MCVGVGVCFHSGSHCFNFIYCTHMFSQRSTLTYQKHLQCPCWGEGQLCLCTRCLFLFTYQTSVCWWNALGASLDSAGCVQKQLSPHTRTNRAVWVLSFLKQPQHGKSLIGTETRTQDCWKGMSSNNLQTLCHVHMDKTGPHKSVALKKNAGRYKPISS